MAQAKRKWFVTVTVYTFAGAVSSMSVGAGLGLMGDLLIPIYIGRSALIVAIAIGVLALTRELQWIALPLPQAPRQTRRVWGMIFPRSMAAMLWGVDLGLIFTTWLTFSGAWLLAAVAILTGDVMFGASLFGLYWLGRALSVWVAPLLLSDAATTSQLLTDITGQRRMFRQIQIVGLVWSITILVAWFITGTSL